VRRGTVPLAKRGEPKGGGTKFMQLCTRVNALQTRVNPLRSRVNALQTRVNPLRSRVNAL